MGNKLCKKKVDAVDSSKSKSPTPFDRIVNRLHLRPSSWKSDSHLNQKQATRSLRNSTDPDDKSNIMHSQPLSKSSDWTEVDLEVPDHEEHVHLRNPKLSLIFNNENETPTPPPRKHKKNLREKIEAVAKTGLQAFQSKKPVEEELCVKKKINYSCPLCEKDELTHNRDHHHHHHHNHENTDSNKNIKNETANEGKETTTQSNDKKACNKRRKNLSVISLPNYNELKLTVAHFDDIDKTTEADKSNNSIASLPNEGKKATTGSTGKLDNYITRCRSFGSLLPQQLKKLRSRKAPADIESDDSFGGLEDWDLGLIEHYNPKDASLPRPRKIQKRNSKDVLSDIESLVVTEDVESKPKPPVRRAESLVKKINREAAESAHKRSNEVLNKPDDDNTAEVSENITPPPSPEPKPQERLFLPNLATMEDGKVEHSGLMKILEQFSVKDKQEALENKVVNDNVKNDENSNQSSLTPSLLEFEKNIAVSPVEDFIHAEKINTDRGLNFGKYSTATVS